MPEDVFGIVRNSRRRAFLRVLKNLGGNASLREIIRRIAVREGNGKYDKRLMKSIQVSLIQTHLPKLQRAGLIMYNSSSGTVRLLELSPSLRYHLELVEKYDVPWSVYYVLLSSSGLILGLIFNNVLAGVISSAFLFSAIIHWIQNRTDVLSSLRRGGDRV